MYSVVITTEINVLNHKIWVENSPYFIYNKIMNSDIMISLIGFAGVCVGALFGYMGKSKKQSMQDARREQEQRDSFAQIFKELQEVKKRLDEHNHYAEKFGEIKLDIAGIKKDVEYIRKDLK